MSAGARSTRAPGHLEFAWALAMVALLPRLFVAIAWSREPVWDGHYYYFGAERIAQGLGYSEDVWVNGQRLWKPWVHYPVGYSALLGVLYAVFGSGSLVAPLFNALLGTVTAVVTYELARRGLSEQRARIAGCLVALHPGLIAQSALVMTETLAACMVAVLGLCAVTPPDRGWRLLQFGLSLGVATVTSRGALTETVWDEHPSVALAAASDTAEHVAAAVALFRDKEARARLGSRGKQLYAERFSLANTVNALLADGASDPR